MPNTTTSFERLPQPALKALAHVGHAVKTARLRCRMTAALMAERLQVSLPTLRKLERGDPGVSLATFMCALWVLGLLEQFAEAIDPHNDRVGLGLEEARLPKRVRKPKTEIEDL